VQASKDLPIFAVQSAIREALETSNRLVLHAPTGSGKSTQVPQMLLDDGLAGDGQIVVLQPRRVAARFLARFVAQQRRVDLGGEVGYQVRFDSKSSAATRIKFETDGILLRQSLLDPDLSHVSVVVFDEFHERHLYGDVLLSRVKLLQETTRPDLKIVVMSATLESDALARYLSPCPIVETEGRTYPVEIIYAAKSARQQKLPVWEQAVAAFEADPPPDNGHTLVFMPGAYEIRKTVAALSQSKATRDIDVVALHGDQRPEDQDRALTPGKRPRVIVATNIAETSLTIPGVTQVIDGGLARKAAYDARRGINTLLIERISRASADQRSGRAGRTAPGRCIRLWSERDHFDRDAPPNMCSMPETYCCNSVRSRVRAIASRHMVVCWLSFHVIRVSQPCWSPRSVMVVFRSPRWSPLFLRSDRFFCQHGRRIYRKRVMLRWASRITNRMSC
jgi:ATP-dependent helicase HrpB